MSSIDVEILAVATVTALACASCGTFLYLRRMSLMSDAISHAILFGIVVAFLFVRDLNSPFLVIAAALTGVLTVVLTQLLISTGKLKSDASIGLVFPVLFSIGVILITQYASHVHIDTDAVLTGELYYVWMDQLDIEVFGRQFSLGPNALWKGMAALTANLVFIIVMYKELKLSTFDAGLAAAMGFSPLLIQYLLVGLASITAVTSFDAVGSILVVALMIAPPAAAYLLTKRLGPMLLTSLLIASLSALLGFWLAIRFDTTIGGMMATACGLLFALSWVFAPERGLASQLMRRHRQKTLFASQMLAVHVYNHEGTDREKIECNVDNIAEHMHWSEEFAQHVIEYSLKQRELVNRNGLLRITEEGRATAEQVIAHT